MEPQTRYEQSDYTLSGSQVMVRGAVFEIGDTFRAGVTVTIRVPSEFASVGDDGSVAATILLNPDEGLGIGEWLREAFNVVDRLGPPLYDET